MGLNSGEVVIRSIGSDLHMDYSAIGQTTHLAARMEQMAMPAERAVLVGLVERIQAAKHADAQADVTAWEREIDDRVYRPYGLTRDELRGILDPADVYGEYRTRRLVLEAFDELELKRHAR